jgi:hypothetical protein
VNLGIGEALRRIHDCQLFDTRLQRFKFLAIGAPKTKRMRKKPVGQVPKAMLLVECMIAIPVILSVASPQASVPFAFRFIPGFDLRRREIVTIVYAAARLRLAIVQP